MARVLRIGVLPEVPLIPVDQVKKTISTAVIRLGDETVAGAELDTQPNIVGAIITVEAQPARLAFLEDPDADDGHPLDADDVLELFGGAVLREARFIREGGTDSTFQITYLRQ